MREASRRFRERRKEEVTILRDMVSDLRAQAQVLRLKLQENGIEVDIDLFPPVVDTGSLQRPQEVHFATTPSHSASFGSLVNEPVEHAPREQDDEEEDESDPELTSLKENITRLGSFLGALSALVVQNGHQAPAPKPGPAVEQALVDAELLALREENARLRTILLNQIGFG